VKLTAAHKAIVLYGKDVLHKEITMEAVETKIEHRFMTFKEKTMTIYKSHMLREEGKEEEANKLFKSVPLEPGMAKIGKEVYGADFLINGGYNLLEANAAYGKDWLNR
jgi:hypothetical protein